MKTQLFLIGVGLAVGAVGVAILAIQLPRKSRLAAAFLCLVVYAAALSFSPTGSLPRVVGAVFLGAIAGSLLGMQLRDRGTLLAFFISAAVVDVFSSTIGPTRALLAQGSESHRRLLESLAVVVPLATSRFAVIGIPDLVGVAALFVALRLASTRLSVAGIVPITSVAAALAIALSWRPLPVFPFLLVGAIFAAAGRSERRPPNRQRPDA